MSDGETRETPPRVFISYAQYEPAHSDRVLALALAHALAADGLDVELDRFHGRKTTDWPRWCEERLDPENTDFVLMVCSAEYRAYTPYTLAVELSRYSLRVQVSRDYVSRGPRDSVAATKCHLYTTY